MSTFLFLICQASIKEPPPCTSGKSSAMVVTCGLNPELVHLKTEDTDVTVIDNVILHNLHNLHHGVAVTCHPVRSIGYSIFMAAGRKRSQQHVREEAWRWEGIGEWKLLVSCDCSAAKEKFGSSIPLPKFSIIGFLRLYLAHIYGTAGYYVKNIVGPV